jgi:hypothetical protein
VNWLLVITKTTSTSLLDIGHVLLLLIGRVNSTIFKIHSYPFAGEFWKLRRPPVSGVLAT